MKSSTESHLNHALESSLRESAPASEFPPGLHRSIIRAVRAANRAEATRLSPILLLQRLVHIWWIPLTGFAGLILLAVWFALHNGPAQSNSTAQSLPHISTAFTTSQEMVEAIPSVTVGVLSDELDKVNEDLNRTTEFLLAVLP